MPSPKDKPYKCNECGERFTHRHSTRFGEDLGTDSVSHHQKVTGHSQQRNPARAEYVDFTVAGRKSGRLTASQQDRATGQYFARCACGRMTSIEQDQWGSAEHCHAEYETVAAGPDTRLFAVLDSDEVAQWIVTNAPSTASPEEVTEALVRSGASARIDIHGNPFARFRVVAADELRRGTLGLSRVLAATPTNAKSSTLWIGPPRISWPGMIRHVGCMVQDYRADDQAFIPFTVQYASMRPADKGKFVKDYPTCTLCGAPSSLVDHDHATGLVRGALCGECNGRLSWIEGLCDPASGTREPDKIRVAELRKRLNDWVPAALAYSHHKWSTLSDAYGLSR